MMSERRPIAVTMGDPAGIGPELVVKLAADPALDQPVVAVGDPGRLRRAAAIVGADLTVRTVDGPEQAAGGPGALDVIATSDVPSDLPFGAVSAAAGAAALAALHGAIDLALAGRVRALATAPVNKESLKAAGCPFPGHTEILADRAGVTDIAMMLFNDELRVVLATIHLPLSDVPGALSIDGELKTIRLAALGARRLGVAAPRVAVAGLNPHAGEGGLFGDEEARIIAPAVDRARAEGIDASGPWPGDTVFMQAREGRFDIVVAQYHDQGLIPVKYLGVDHGVNATLGLPFVRTSVDHGTAFDIAGTGKADHASLMVAVRQAAQMTERAVSD
jgi:4-hydroxythreonine-4-phosphate dehydrogenase